MLQFLSCAPVGAGDRKTVIKKKKRRRINHEEIFERYVGAGTGTGRTTGPRRRTGGGTAGTSQSPGEDIDSRVTNSITSGIGRGARMAGAAGKKVYRAGKTVATAMKAKKFMTLGAFIATAGIIIVLLIAIIGAASFIMNMPGMVRDKIVNTFDTLWQEAKGLIVGKDAVAANPTAIKNLAEYLEEMGYDLLYNGFATKLEKDKEGNIKDIESKYLAAYIAAEERNYLIANENHNVKSIWKGVSSLFGDDPKWDEPWGTGMIVLEETLVEQILHGLRTY